MAKSLRNHGLLSCKLTEPSHIVIEFFVVTLNMIFGIVVSILGIIIQYLIDKNTYKVL